MPDAPQSSTPNLATGPLPPPTELRCPGCWRGPGSHHPSRCPYAPERWAYERITENQCVLTRPEVITDA